MDPIFAEHIARIVAETLGQFHAQQSSSPRVVKMPLPVYHGRQSENITTWIFQADQAFVSQGVDNNMRMSYIAGILGESALQWYLNRIKAAESDEELALDNWDMFTQEISGLTN
jgi:hypothetical protein